MPAGVQRQVRGPDCADNRGVSAGRALGRVCPGSSGRSFRPRSSRVLGDRGLHGVALTPGVSLPGVRPPVDATISG